MPEDVRAALERFQRFLGKYTGGGVIDEASGFTAADGELLAGEIQMAAHLHDFDESILPNDAV